ncbi:MAG: putative monovalent cation/H+ antiporter subunit A [Chloroflexi bacterium]|nr:MAG: putative monovalent cation/H+ antiporter subunit A [Chloroflexota bacterium]
MSIELFVIVFSGFGLALVMALVHRWLGRAIGWVAALLPLGIFIALALQLPHIGEGEPLRTTVDWVPSLGISLSFYADGLSLLLALIVSGVGALILIYGGGYLAGDRQIGRFYTIILVFMASMLGVVLADNIFLLFVFWELTSISSYLLIGFKHEYESSRDAARQALLVTGSGGLALLAGLILLGIAGGSWEFSSLLGQGDAIQASPLFLPALILILAGAFTKSAQFPFHFWLPNAMAAPTPVSAYLHSATMVKAGVYLLARVSPIFAGTDVWFAALVIVGGVTALLGAWLSWQQTDLKRILAYSTVSALGTLVLFLGIGSKVAVKTAILFLLVHSLYKGALFMAAGAIDHETGTRDVTKLGGLARLMPLTLAGVGLAAVSMAGLPPLLGFISKELMYEATLEAQGWSLPLTMLALATNVFMVAAAAIVLIVPFFGKRQNPKELHIHEAPISMWLGPVVLGGVALLTGLFSNAHWFAEDLIGRAVTAVYNTPVEVHLGLFHGFTPMLQLSIVTVTLGVVVFALHQRLRPVVVGVDTAVSRIGPEQWYKHGLDGLLSFAGGVTKLLQNGFLRYYILFVMGTVVVLVGVTLLRQDAIVLPAIETPVRFVDAVIALTMIVGTMIVVKARSRLYAVAGLGLVGYGMAMLFILFSAPDLAMTQFAIETLTVILFVLVLFRLPKFETISIKATHYRDALVSIAVGTMMASVVLAAKAFNAPTPLSDFFAENSYTLAQGRNIVNVILVDFRGADTIVEITVLTVAAIGVYGLLRSQKVEEREVVETAVSEQTSQNGRVVRDPIPMGEATD